MTLEPTPRSPEPLPDLDELRHRWVRVDLAARALGFEEGTILAWMGQKKVRSTWVGNKHLVQFDDLERFVGRLPAAPTHPWDQDELIAKQSGQVKGATSRLTNLLTDTSQADLFHQLPIYRGDVQSIDISLWVLAQRIEAFRARLKGPFWEQGYRTAVSQPSEGPESPSYVDLSEEPT